MPDLDLMLIRLRTLCLKLFIITSAETRGERVILSPV